MALKTCRTCGLEANTVEELDKFVKQKGLPHGRASICKPCINIEQTRRYKNRERTPRQILMNAFNTMKTRCYKSDHPTYRSHGARGITICQEWLDDRKAFIEWALANGWKRGLSIDRIDNDGPYSSENCRWVTQKEQTHNRRGQRTNWMKGIRICSRCGIEKPLEDFHRSGAKGRRYDCKECIIARRLSS